jgi:hypothetical protein
MRPTLAPMKHTERQSLCLVSSAWPRAFLILFAYLALPSTVRAELIPGLYNTGMNDDRSLVATSQGNWEFHYGIVSPPGMQTRIVRTGDYGYFRGMFSLPIATDSQFGWGAPAGIYVFHTEFDLVGLNTNTARLRGSWKVYDRATMLLNGVPVAAYTNAADWRLNPFVAFEVTSGFVEGRNVLDCVVTNTGGLLLQLDGLQGTALPAGPGYRPIPDLRNTGTLPGGALAPERGPDSGYTLVSVPVGVTLGAPRVKYDPNTVPVEYGGCSGRGAYRSPYAQWIGPREDPCNFAGVPPGTYRYRHTFSLSGLLPETVKLDGRYAADGTTSIFINGLLVMNVLPGSQRYFAVTNGFVAGLNSLEFAVENDRDAGMGGGALIVEGLQGSARLDPNATQLGIRVSRVELSWDTATNVTYQVQTRSSLTGDEWVNYGAPVVGVDGVVRSEVPIVGDRCFYRLVVVP